MNDLKNINRGSDGWTVRIVRDYQEYSKYFRFSDGGVAKALQKAKRWRNQKFRELGPRRWREGPRKRASNNTSGTTGVSKNVYGRWVATWQEEGVPTLQDLQNQKRGRQSSQIDGQITGDSRATSRVPGRVFHDSRPIRKSWEECLIPDQETMSPRE